jgi:hypothetical protein
MTASRFYFWQRLHWKNNEMPTFMGVSSPQTFILVAK